MLYSREVGPGNSSISVDVKPKNALTGIPSIIVVSTTNVSYMIVARKVTEGTFKQKTRIKLPCK